jgi:hypothetical protein
MGFFSKRRMHKKLQTMYKIRAAIPAQVAGPSMLMEKARELGLNLVQDVAGNVEGAWKSSLLNLDATIEGLRSIGLRDFMVERSVITTIVSVPEGKASSIMEIVKKNKAERLWQARDIFSELAIIGCTLNCENALEFVNAVQEFGVPKIIAFESYEIVTKKTNA